MHLPGVAAAAGAVIPLCQAASCASALGAGPLAALPVALLRHLSNAAASLPEADQQHEQQQQQQQQQRRRRQSHYAATPSGRLSSTPALAAASARLVSSSRWISSSAAAASSSCSSRERGYASAAAAQPAYAYADPRESFDDLGGPAHLGRDELLHQAHAAAAKLKAQAMARLEAVHAERPVEPLCQPSDASGAMELRRVADLPEEQTDELPMWERLNSACAKDAVHNESAAALQMYRQEVLHGQDPEVAMSCSPGFVHVPFLRSGMFAAHQGYSLQSDLSRVRLQSRLADPKHGISARVVASATGLNVVMEASRRARTPNSPFHLPHLPGLTVAMATPAELAECLGAPARPPVRTDAYLNEEEDEELMAARELLSWEAAQEERKAVAAAVRASKAPWPPAEVDSHLAAEVQPLLSARKLRFKRPAAPKEDVLEALAALPGVNRDVMEAALDYLYGYRTKLEKMFKMVAMELPSDPEACQQRIAAAARLILEDLGAEGFEALARSWPCVLLMDPAKHGRPLLDALHMLELDASQRGELLLKHPRLLLLGVEEMEDGLLPVAEYLQSLGMTGAEFMQCLKVEYDYCQPATLNRLKAAVAFWTGKGMTRPNLVKLLTSWPRAAFGSLSDWELKLDWLADHIGMTVNDVAVLPGTIRHSLVGNTGPRVAFALARGYQVARPSTQGGICTGSTVALSALVIKCARDAAKRCGASLEEYEAFKQDWLAADFPAWLEQRKPGIDYYRSLTQKHRKPSGAATAAPPRQPGGQQQQQEQL